MEEKNKLVKQAVEEIKTSDESKLEEIIKQWFESTRMAGLKIGAQMISAAVAGVIQKHLRKTAKPSLRDHQRCIDEIISIISVQLKENTQQNDSTVEKKDE